MVPEITLKQKGSMGSQLQIIEKIAKGTHPRAKEAQELGTGWVGERDDQYVGPIQTKNMPNRKKRRKKSMEYTSVKLRQQKAYLVAGASLPQGHDGERKTQEALKQGNIAVSNVGHKQPAEKSQVNAEDPPPSQHSQSPNL